MTTKTYSQPDWRIAVHTPLGENVLLLGGLELDEGLSRLFRMKLELFSVRDDLSPSDLVGKPIDVMLRLLDESRGDGRGRRWINGFVSRFACHGREDRLTRYEAEVVPWLWFLGRRSDCRIFQGRSVVQIVEDVFREAGFDAFDASGLRGAYPARDYCVQYRESDLAFVSRLLEEEGIFYRFRHKAGRHEMVLGDGAHAYEECEERLVSCAPRSNAPEWSSDLTQWRHEYEFVSGGWAGRDYNFETPGESLDARGAGKVAWPESRRYEQYDYPGEWTRRSEGERVSRIRHEEEQCRQEVVRGAGTCRTFFAGGIFEVDRHHVPSEEGREWMLTRVVHRVRADTPYTTGGAPGGKSEPSAEYENHFECIPADVVFRPERVTPRPIVRGAQTAVVVGPAGEELHVDESARVKVQFHWDRRGRRDENSACWMRVSQPWAGVGYGGLCIPRVGQEVIVEFEEGNPDRPIVNGRVYNASTMPPVSNAGRDASTDPAPESIRQAAMMTTLRSQSLGGSGGHNEITMNDTGGAEGLYFKAQMDEVHQVGNNQMNVAGNDVNSSVGNNHMVVVGNNASEVVGNSRSTDVVDALELDADTILNDARSSITLVCGASRVHIDKAGFVTITGTVITSAAALSNSVSGQTTEIVGAAVLTHLGALVQMTGDNAISVNALASASIDAAKTDLVAGGETVIQGAAVKIN